MPRKKVLGAATPRQVLEFYETADEATLRVVGDVAQGIIEKRFTRKNGDATAKPTRAKKVKATVSEPAGD